MHCQRVFGGTVSNKEIEKIVFLTTDSFAVLLLRGYVAIAARYVDQKGGYWFNETHRSFIVSHQRNAQSVSLLTANPCLCCDRQ